MKCANVYNLFFNPGEVTEIRALGLSKSNKAWQGWAGGAGIVYGYFDNAAAFGQAAESLDGLKASGIYFTLNPVIPDLLARAANRLKAADVKSVSTADHDILCIRWLPIDLDPVRPSGISSTNEELEAAKKVGKKIAAWLKKEFTIAPGIPAYSGNGIHLAYRLDDLPNTEETGVYIKDVLRAIEYKFRNKKVDIDLKVFNPSRGWKLYGTTPRKGDHTQARPHRKSYIPSEFLDPKK